MTDTEIIDMGSILNDTTRDMLRMRKALEKLQYLANTPGPLPEKLVLKICREGLCGEAKE